jgi:uncharacterized protein YgbK (DUF1537 family)
MSRRDRLLQEGIRVVVLDDDPTGIQTVQGCLVLTDGSVEGLEAALRDREPYFYILTNSRAFQPEQVRRRIREITLRILQANRPLGHRIVFVSRSDSTLRSHFPLELDTVVRTAGLEPAARFLVPAFFEGQRITDGDIHYLLQDGVRVPCHETEFALDPVFGYATAFLPGYIEEKTLGRVKSRDVLSIPRALLRSGTVRDLDRLLQGLAKDRHVVVNAESYRELDRFSEAVLDRIARGSELLFQSAASLVKSLVGCPDAGLVPGRGHLRDGPGLILAGSHVERTTRQLAALLEAPGLEPVEVDPARLLADEAGTFKAVRGRMDRALASGLTPVVYTSRRQLRLPGRDEQLAVGQRISRFLSRLVAVFPSEPAFVIAKGGITSHDVLVQGLGVQQARVWGQAAPGVPVICMPRDHRWAGAPFVIFPGNVGPDDALKEVYLALSGPGPPMPEGEAEPP